MAPGVTTRLYRTRVRYTPLLVPPSRVIRHPRRPARFLAISTAVILSAAISCSTILTKSRAPILPGLRRATSGIGHPFTGVRCEWMYLGAAGMAFPPFIPVVLVDLPLSTAADVVVLPVDLVVNSREPWSMDHDCGINLH